ncbi:MAG: YraN family protein [Butyricicoccus sp.]
MTAGEWGEARAARWLEEHGFRVIARNYRCRWGEIDLIAQDQRYIVFAEVKARKSVRYGTAGQAVTCSKQIKLTRTAQDWLQKQPSALQPRFDVIEVYPATHSTPEHVVHIPNAFEAIE